MNIVTHGLRRERVPTTEERARASRRDFFRKTGLGLAGVGVLLTACESDEDASDARGTAVDLGTGDVGVLNYAFALEQIEAAFYARVLSGGYYLGLGARDPERQVLEALEAHERAHRAFFAEVIPTVGTAIPDLEVDFSGIDFGDRASVLAAAQTFEDLGVSAYNGAGRLLTNPDYLTFAGKIVSVEARHAAVIRDLLQDSPTAFADGTVVDADGLDLARTPAEVLATAAEFVATALDASKLPA